MHLYFQVVPLTAGVARDSARTTGSHPGRLRILYVKRPGILRQSVLLQSDVAVNISYPKSVIYQQAIGATSNQLNHSF